MSDLCRGWMILYWPATVTPGEPIAWRFMLSRLGGIASESPQSSAPAADQRGDWSHPDGLIAWDRASSGRALIPFLGWQTILLTALPIVALTLRG